MFWYKHNVLSKVRISDELYRQTYLMWSYKIEAAFNKTWDDAALVQLIKQELSRFDLLTPDLEHASLQSLAAKLSEVHPRRQEQDFVDSIVKGEMTGSYFLLVGPKVRYSCALPGVLAWSDSNFYDLGSRKVWNGIRCNAEYT